MASGLTSPYNIPYPLATDPVDVHGDMFELANRVDNLFEIAAMQDEANTFTNTNIFTVNSASTAVRITQTGTGEAFRVEDSANPDANAFIIDATGDTTLGKNLIFRGATSGTTTLQATAIASGTLTLPALTGTLAINPTTTIGDVIYASATGTPGTLARLAGNTATQPSFLTSTGNGTANTTTSFTSSTGSGNVVLATSPTLTTPVLDTINVSGAAVAAALWNTILTTGSISMGGALTTGGVNIANGTAFNGTVAIASGAGTVNKTVNIGTSSTSGTTTVTIGSSSGATSTVALNGTLSVTGNATVTGNTTINGDLTVNGTTTTVNSNTLTVDDKNIEMGAVPSGTVSTTGTVGSITGTGPWTATITGMSSTVGLVVGSAIAATNGTGSLGGAGTYIVATIPSATSITYTATGGTTPVAGTVTTITTTGATDSTANGGGITLKGATDKTITWDSTNTNWTSSEHWNLVTGKVFKINNTQVLSNTAVLGLTPTINAIGYTLSGGTTAVAVTFAGGAAYTISGTNAQTYTMPSSGGTLALNVTTTIGDIIYASATGTPGTLARLAGNTATQPSFLTSTGNGTANTTTSFTSSSGSGNVVLATSATLTTPTIDTINVSGAAIAAALWNTTLTTGSISMGNALTTGSVNIANGTALNGSINIGSGVTTAGTKTINLGATGGAGSTTTITIGSTTGTSTTTVLGTFRVGVTTLAQGVNGTVTLPATAGTLALNPTTTIGDIIYASATGTPGTLARLAGNTAAQTAFLASTGNGTANTTTSFISSTGTAGSNVVLATSPTITTPTIDTINISGAAITAALWNTTLTTGSISMGGALTSGSVNIANGTALAAGSVNIASGAGTGNKTIAIGTSATAGTTAVTIGSSSGATSTININGTLTNTGNATITGNTTINGDLTVNGTTTTINSATLTVDDKNIEMGAVVAGTVSATGTVGSITGTGPWTATITGMSDTADLVVGSVIAATNGVGSLGAGGTYVVASIVSGTSITYTATGGTTPVAGTITAITTTGATDATANGGGVILKGATDKTILWDSTNTNWTSSEHLNLVTGKVFKINNTQVLSNTAVLGLTPTINATGFRLSGGTTAKYVQINNDIILAGTDGSTLNIGAGGTLGSAAFTASTAYEPAFATLPISKGGTGTGTAPTQYGVIYASSATSYASTAAGTNTQVLIGNASGAPTWTNISGLSVSSATTATNLSGTTVNSIPYQSASATTSYIGIGTANQVLTVNGTGNGYVWSTPSPGFVNPMTTLGDIIYGAASGTATRLAGNTSATRSFLGQTGDGTNSAAPSWTSSTGTGNVVLGNNPSISGPTFIGVTTLANSRVYGFSRTVPVVVNDIVELGSSTITNGGMTFEIDAVVTSGGFSTSKKYLIAVGFDETSNNWRVVAPISDSGLYLGTNNFEIDINVASAQAFLRLRRTAGSTAGTAFFTLTVTSNSPVFTESSATASVAAPTAYYGGAVITQSDGAATVYGTVTGNSFIPTSSTVPTNGMYLSAANNLSFSTNSTIRVNIDTNGAFAITHAADRAIQFARAGTNTFTIEHDASRLYFWNASTTTNAFTILNNSFIGINNSSPTARLQVNSGAVGEIATIVQGFSGQTANIQEWRTATPTTPTWVDQNAVLNTSNTPTSNNQVANKLYVDTAVAAVSSGADIIPLDDISGLFNGMTQRFVPRYQGTQVTILNPLSILLTINGIIQYVDSPDYVWMSPIARRGFFVDRDGQLQFSEAVPPGSEFDARIMAGNAITTRNRVYPFKPLDILLGG